MAFNVTFYSFSKKKNSTARPTGSGTTYACRIKAPSGIIHPIIEITSLSDTIPTFNYAYIPDFDGRFYYVREWTLEPGQIWTAQLDVDALASWKTVIGAQSFYVLRSSAAHDGLIKDTMYPTRATYTYSILAGSSGAWWDLGSSDQPLTAGYYVVGLLSYAGDFDRIGGVNYIAMLPVQFKNFLDAIYSPSDASAFMAKVGSTVGAVFAEASQELTEEEKSNLAYVVENPFTDYIKSITWVPAAPVSSTIQNSLYLGPNELTGFFFRSVFAKDHATFTSRFQVQQHPLASTRGKYLNTEPFTEYYLRLPKMGLQRVPGDLIADRAYLWVSLQIDPITGQGLYTLLTSQTEGLVNAIEVMRWYSQVGVEVQIAQTKDTGERAQAIMNIAGLALNTLQNPGSITQLPSAIGDIERSRNASGDTIGRSGGWLGLAGGQDSQPYLISIFHDVADEDNAQNGRPLCAVRTPASLSGYMMIQDADISIYGTEEEHDIIKETMESGFYYE